MNSRIEHEKLNEVLAEFASYVHEQLDKAMICGALDPDEYTDESFVLVKIILTICGEAKRFAPLDKRNKATLNNLKHFIG